MSEKTVLLPTAPADFVPGDGAASGPGQAPPPQPQPPHETLQMPRIVIVPGLEFDSSRKYRYGMHSLAAAILIFIAFILVEMRDCAVGPMIDLDRLQALHISLMVFAAVLYLLSLFGIADYIFQYKLFFLAGALLVYMFAGLMVWMTYEAAVNPCVKVFNAAPIDLTFDPNKNVFSRGDTIGIIVLILDIFATLLMISAALNFWKRY